MSLDNRVVSISFDNTNFNSKIQDSINYLESINSKLNTLSGVDFTSLQSGIKNVNSDIKNISVKGIENITTAANKTNLGKISDQADIASKSLDEINTRGISEISRVADNVDMSGISTAADKVTIDVQDSFSAIEVFAKRIIENIADSVFDLIGGAWNSVFGTIVSKGSTRAENLEKAQFLIEGLGYDWQQAYEDANYAVTDTAYGLDEAAVAAANLAATGIKQGDEMKEVLLGISGVAALTSGDYGSLSQIFVKIAGSGKAMMHEFNQFSNRGLNMAKYVSDYINSDDSIYEEFMNAVYADVNQNGELSAASQEIISLLDENGNLTDSAVRAAASGSLIKADYIFGTAAKYFGEHAKDANETYTGAVANFKAALGRIGEAFITPYRDMIRDLANMAKPLVNLTKSEILMPIIETWKEFTNGVSSISKTVTTIFNTLDKNPTIQFFDDEDNQISAITALFQAVSKLIQAIYTPLGQTFLDAFAEKFPEISNFIKWMSKANGDLANTDIGNNVYAFFWNFSKWVKKVQADVDKFINSDAFKSFINLSGEILNVLLNVLKLIFNVISKIFKLATNSLVIIEPILALIFDTIADILSFVDDLFDSLNASTILDDILNIVTEIIQAIVNSGALQSAIKLIKELVSSVFKIVKKIFNSISNTGILDTIKFIINTITTVVGQLLEKVSSIIDLVTRQLDYTRINKIKSIINQITELISKIVNNFIDPIVQTIAGILDYIISMFTESNNISGIVQTIFDCVDTILDFIGEILNIVGDIIDAISKSGLIYSILVPIINIVTNIGNHLKEILNEHIIPIIKKVMNSGVEGILNTIKGILVFLLENVITPLSSALSKVIGYIATFIAQNLDSILTGISDLLTKIEEKLGPIVKNVKSFIDTHLKSVIENISSAIGGFLSNLTGANNEANRTSETWNAIKGIWSGFKSVLDGITNGIKTAIGWLLSLFGVTNEGLDETTEGINDVSDASDDAGNSTMPRRGRRAVGANGTEVSETSEASEEITNLSDAMNSLDDPFARVTEKVGGFAGAMQNLSAAFASFNNDANPVLTIIQNILTFVANVTNAIVILSEKVNEYLSKYSLKTIVFDVMELLTGLAAIDLTKAFDDISRAWSSSTVALQKLVGTVNSTINQAFQGIKDTKIKNIAISVLILVIAISILMAQIAKYNDPAIIATAIATVTHLLAAVAMFVYLLAKVGGTFSQATKESATLEDSSGKIVEKSSSMNNSLSQMGRLMLMMSTSVLAMSAGMSLILKQLQNFPDIQAAAAAVGVVLGAMSALMLEMVASVLLILEYLKNTPKTAGVNTTLKSISSFIISLSVAMLIMSGALAIVITVVKDAKVSTAWEAVGILGAFIAAFTVLSAILLNASKNSNAPSIAAITVFVLAISTAILALVGALVIIINIVNNSLSGESDPNNFWISIGVLAGMITVLSSFTALIERMSSGLGNASSIYAIAILIISISTAVLSMIGGLELLILIFRNASPDEFKTALITVLAIYTALTLFTASLIEVSKNSVNPMVAKNLALMAVLITTITGSMLILVGALELLILILENTSPEEFMMAFIALVVLFGELAATVVIMANAIKEFGAYQINPGALAQMSLCVMLLATVFLELAGALLLVSQAGNVDALIAGSIAMGVLYAAIAASMAVLSKTVVDVKKVLELSAGFAIMAASLAILAGGLYIIGQIDTDKLWPAVGVIGIFIALFLALAALATTPFGGALSAALTGIATGVLLFSTAIFLLASAMFLVANAFTLISQIDSEGLNNIMLFIESMGTAIANGITNFVSTLAGSADAIFGALDTLLIALVTFLTNRVKVIGDLVEIAVRTALDIILGIIFTALSSLIENFVVFIDEVLSVIADHSESICNSIRTILENIAIAILTFLLNIGQWMSDHKEEIQTIVSDLLDMIIYIWITFITNFLKNLAEKMPEIVDYLTVIINEIDKLIAVFLQNVINLVVSSLVELLRILSVKMPEIVEYLTVIINGLTDLIFNTLIHLIERLTDLLMPLEEFLEEVINVVSKLVGHLLKEVLPQLIEDSTEGIVKAVLGIVTGFLNGLAEKIPDVIEAGCNLIASFLQGIADNIPKLTEKAADCVVEFCDGMTKAIETKRVKIRTSVKNLIDCIKDTIIYFITGKDPGKSATKSGAKPLSDSGSDIIDNLIDGMKSAATNIVDKIKDIGETIKDGFCKFFNINSPSSVMADDVGQWITAGVGVGIEEGTEEYAVPAVEDSCEDIKSAYEDNLTDSSFDADHLFDGVTDSLSNLSNEFNSDSLINMDSIAESGNDITNAFSGLGSVMGDMNLPNLSLNSDDLTDSLNNVKDAASDMPDLSMDTNVDTSGLNSSMSDLNEVFSDFPSNSADDMSSSLSSISDSVSGLDFSSSTESANNLSSAFSNLSVAGSEAGTTLSSSISSLTDSLSDSEDNSYTITPVLDLDNVYSGTAEIDDMMSGIDSSSMDIGLNSSYSASSLDSSLSDNNTLLKTAAGSSNSTTFIQNNYSPSALSRIDIYRQTNNQFSSFNMKEAYS